MVRLADPGGAAAERLPGDAAGQVDLPALLSLLAARGLNHLLVEGGAGLLGALNDTGLIAEVRAFIAPKLVGGVAAPGPLGGAGAALMRAARPLNLRSEPLERVDHDPAAGRRSRRAAPARHGRGSS